MLATTNSRRFRGVLGRGSRNRLEAELRTLHLAPSRAWLASLAIVLCLVVPHPSPGADAAPAADSAAFARKAEAAFKATRVRFDAETNNAEAEWQFARACYDWADFATSNSQRADIAQQGIAASRRLLGRTTNSAPGHYYLALNLSQLARTKTLGALKILDQMEQEFNSALSLDAGYDFGGADRGLGMIYLEAPGWPASIGSRAKAKTHLQQALKLSPGHPENLLNLIEAELKWGDREGAARDFKKLDEAWPQAQKQLTGETWERDWADWVKRRAEVQKKLAVPPKAFEPPRKI